jgi:putative addiction module component (TIGR02574 family)
MTVSNWTQADSDRAQEIWSDYEQLHDLSEKGGQTAGIDPASGRIWIGQSIQDVIAQRDADGSESPLFFVRIGSATYYWKGAHKDQIELLHKAWDPLIESGWEPELTNGQKAEFDRRLDDLDANPQCAVPLEKLIAHVRRER